MAGRRSVVSGGVLIAVAAVLSSTSCTSIEQSLFEKGAAEVASRSNAAVLDDDALRVAIAGSSAPLPSKDRAKACVAVFAGGKFYVVDVGPESVENLVLWRIPMPAPDTSLTRDLFAATVNDVRKGDWDLADDGSLYTLPVGSSEVRIDRVRY
jgi:hypothetical protein